MLSFFERLQLRLGLATGRLTTGRLVVGVLIKKDNTYLLIDEKRKNGVFLNIPAGHVEPRETPIEAAIREAKEECGLSVKLTGVRLVLCNTWQQGKHSVYWIFNGEVDGGELCTENGSQAHWLTLNEWKARMQTMESMPAIPYVLESVEQGTAVPVESLYFIDRRGTLVRESIL